MTPALGPLAAALLFFCVLAEAGREIGFKLAAQSASTTDTFVLTILKQPALWIAIVLGAAEIVAWILVLQHAPLAVAYPIVSLAYVAVPLAGVLILRERLSQRQAFGCLLITFGAVCVGLSGV